VDRLNVTVDGFQPLFPFISAYRTVEKRLKNTLSLLAQVAHISIKPLNPNPRIVLLPGVCKFLDTGLEKAPTCQLLCEHQI